MALGILAVGMIFIGGVFPVAIHFSTVATERSMAAVIADEAFAKIKLYAKGAAAAGDDVDFSTFPWGTSADFNDVLHFYSFIVPSLPPQRFIGAEELMYPSISPAAMESAKQYCWSAICRRTEPDPISRNVQVTVFVCRMTGTGNNYWDRLPDDPLVPLVFPWIGTLGTSGWPVPVCVGVTATGNPGGTELSIIDFGDADGDGVDEGSFINDGCTIVDNVTGRMYRVMERYADRPNVILLDGGWQGILPPVSVWVIPAPQGGGRYPCIEVYQRLMQF